MKEIVNNRRGEPEGRSGDDLEGLRVTVIVRGSDNPLQKEIVARGEDGAITLVYASEESASSPQAEGNSKKGGL